MAKLIINARGRPQQILELDPGLYLLGRALACDIHLDDPSVSGRHCEIMIEAGGIVVKDLKSTNGTFINGKPVDECIFLSDQVLTVGTVQITQEAAPVPVISIPVATPPPAPTPTLLTGDVIVCSRHPDRHATMVCRQCQEKWCGACIKEIRRVGGQAMKLCPACGGICEPLFSQDIAGKKSKSLFGKIPSAVTQFIDKTFKSGKPKSK
jgi:hypothetical protein